MILVDTSVWIDHLRRSDAALGELLREEGVLCHPFVIGELACGRLRQREEVLSLLGNLPCAVVASDSEVLALIERRSLMGSGIGWVDAHLLAAALLAGAPLWTRDKRLAIVAEGIGLLPEE